MAWTENKSRIVVQTHHYAHRNNRWVLEWTFSHLADILQTLEGWLCIVTCSANIHRSGLMWGGNPDCYASSKLIRDSNLDSVLRVATARSIDIFIVEATCLIDNALTNILTHQERRIQPSRVAASLILAIFSI